MPWDGAQSQKSPKGILRDSAYQPKTYAICLEKGVFPTPFVADNPTQYPFTYKYALKLIFSKSPYPPPDEWEPAYQERVSDNGVSERVQFVSRDLGLWNTFRWDNCISM